LITIRVEPEYRSVARSISGQGSKGELNASIATESEIVDLLRRLMLIRRSDSSMLAIGEGLWYRFVARSLSGWGPKGDLNALIIAESKVMDFLRLLKLIRQSDSSMIAIGVEPDYRSVDRSLSECPNAPIALVVVFLTCYEMLEF
jgi:hypothetical protein